MELPWGDEKSKKFVTNVGLITTTGPFGENVMACEWTHHISYSPGMIAVCIGPNRASYENIKETKEFGVNIASTKQNILASIAGTLSGKQFDKIKALKEIGFEFFEAKKIKAPLIKGAALSLECKLVKEVSLGDHTMFVGEVIEAIVSDIKPLVYHDGKYWKLTHTILKPAQKELEKIRKIVEKHKKTLV